jgi:hypothetical protein
LRSEKARASPIAAIFELSTLVGNYPLLSMQLQLFGADRPAITG